MRCDSFAISRRTFLVAGAVVLSVPVLAQETSKTIRIGVIGSGNIGGTVGTLWVKAGHEVMFSSRHPETLTAMVEGLGDRARTGTPEEAIAFADAVFVAVPYKAYPDLSKSYAAALKGKVVLDAGNATRARDGELYDEVEANGIGLTSEKYFPGAKLVRAFNAANYKVFAKEGANGGTERAGGRMAIPIAGDDPGALKVAEDLVRDAGFDPVVVGPLKDASKFAMGSAGFGHDQTAAELRKMLGLTP